MHKPVSGFSKMSKQEKIDWLARNYFSNNSEAMNILRKYWNSDAKLQRLHDDFTENAVSNYYLPFGIAPNFLINDKLYTLPMVIEESSVVAAASNAAKFWLDRGGFHAEVQSTEKNGQVHLDYFGDKRLLIDFFEAIKSRLFEAVSEIEKNIRNVVADSKTLN